MKYKYLSYMFYKNFNNSVYSLSKWCTGTGTVALFLMTMSTLLSPFFLASFSP